MEELTFWLEIITGPMFGGKSEQLIHRLRRHHVANQSIKIFKPKGDTRDFEYVISRNGEQMQAEVFTVDSFLELYNSKKFDVIAFDETQFLLQEYEDLPNHINILANMGYKVIVSGLDMDWQGIPYSGMVKLMGMANKVKKFEAICHSCYSEHAIHSYLVSGLPDCQGVYEARCRKCFARDKKDYELRSELVKYFPLIKQNSELLAV